MSQTQCEAQKTFWVKKKKLGSKYIFWIQKKCCIKKKIVCSKKLGSKKFLEPKFFLFSQEGVVIIKRGKGGDKTLGYCSWT